MDGVREVHLEEEEAETILLEERPHNTEVEVEANLKSQERQWEAHRSTRMIHAEVDTTIHVEADTMTLVEAATTTTRRRNAHGTTKQAYKPIFVAPKTLETRD